MVTPLSTCVPLDRNLSHHGRESPQDPLGPWQHWVIVKPGACRRGRYEKPRMVKERKF